jgi:MFS superfamily sulfate permease-like transporter
MYSSIAGLRLGFVASFVPVAIVKGLTIGLALTMLVTLAPLLLGVSRESNVFIDQAWALIDALDDVNGWTVILGAGALALIFELRDRLPRLPAALIVVALGTLIVRVGGLEGHGVAIVGPLDNGLPALGWPDGVDAGNLRDLLPGAAAVLLLGAIETLSAARATGERHPEGEDTDRELAAVAAANIGAGVFGGLVVSGNTDRTRANATSGAKSKLALVVAAVLVGGLLLLTGLLEYTPLAVLAAVAVAIVLGLIDLHYLEQLYGLARAEAGAAGISGARTLYDFAGALCVIGAVLVLGVLPGFIVAVAAAIVLLMVNVARPRVSIDTDLGFEQPADAPGVVILRPETSLFFANAGHVQGAIEGFAEDNGSRTVVLDIEGTQRLDATGAEMIVELAAFLEERKQQLLVVRSLSPARRLLVATADSHRTHLDVFGSVDAAVASVTAPPRVDERRLRRRPA